jgi:hypothetical protein
MTSALTKGTVERDFAERLAAKFDEMTLSFVSRMRRAEVEAALAVNARIGSQDSSSNSDLFER